MKFLSQLTILFSLILLFACGEDEENLLYDSPVYFTVDARSGRPDYTLNSAGHYKIFENNRIADDRGVGLGGLLIVTSGEILEGTSFYHLFAYDLACPHEKSREVKVVPQAENKAKCPECGSEYNLFGGGRVSGISKHNLVRYHARPDNQKPGVFTITR